MRSAVVNPRPVKEYLEEEVAAGRVAGPFDPGSMQGIQISRFGVIPKGSQVEAWRLILDLSHPANHSVNDGIDRELCSLQYATVDQAIAHILQLGEGALLAKVDVKSAYRNIPVHREDRHLLGMMWDGNVYIDTTLPFGLRSAPKLFCAVAEALAWILQKHGVAWSLHYIDDFLFAGSPLSPECKKNLEITISVCRWLGLPLKTRKIEGPTTKLIFLGIMLDTNLMEISLPEAKLHQLKVAITEWKLKKKCRKRELLSLIGKLAHACKVVPAGRSFLRRMIITATKVKHMDHWVHLNADFRADLAWWDTFLEFWNRRSMFAVHDPKWQPSITCSTDASGSWGCGASWQDQWFQLPWDKKWKDYQIAVKELLPIVLACALWGPQWQHKQVLALCDNMAVVQVIAAQTSKESVLMHLIRCLHFFCALYDISLRCEHIPGVHNVIADSLSRNNMQEFHRHVPHAVTAPVRVPPALVQLMQHGQQDWLSSSWRTLLSVLLRTV